MNSTIIDNTPVDALPTVYKSYGTVDFLIGLAICQGASVANAAGINLTKLDHVRNERVPKDQRRRDWLRPLWLAGLALYIASQLVGSTLALEYLRAEYVAPLGERLLMERFLMLCALQKTEMFHTLSVSSMPGSTSLIFNFIFAKLLVGTSITRMDIAGTAVIILGVCGVVGFGNLRVSTAQDIENNLNLETLKHLWSRGGWIGYFVCLELVSGLVFYVASIIDRVWVERQELETAVDPEERIASARAPRDETFMQTVNRRRLVVRFAIKKAVENWTVSKPDVVIRKLSGLTWAVAGGLLAGQTLVFAKSAVKLVSSGADQLASPLSIFILVLLAFAAVVQIYCLNKGKRDRCLRFSGNGKVLTCHIAAHRPKGLRLYTGRSALLCYIYCFRIPQLAYLPRSVQQLQGLGLRHDLAVNPCPHPRRRCPIIKEAGNASADKDA